MVLLDKNGVEFFRQELTKETDRQIAMFEQRAPSEITEREMGRIRLYEEKVKINHHFMLTERDRGAFESNHPHHGLLGKISGLKASSALLWREVEGLRYGIRAEVETDLTWEDKTPPKARLTKEGKFRKKPDYENIKSNS
jgi:hypothetical protein